MPILWVLVFLRFNTAFFGPKPPKISYQPGVYGIFLTHKECEREELAAKIFAGALHRTAHCVKMVRTAPTHWLPAR